MFLKSRGYDIFQISFIALYTILIFLILAFDESIFRKEDMTIFYAIELSLLGVFVMDITIHLLAFRKMYLQDIWNVFDLLVILLCLAFVLIDIFVDNQSVKSFLKVRGVFRLLRIFLLVRKLNTLRAIREMEQRRMLQSTMLQTANGGYDMKSPLEQVIEILTRLRDSIDVVEKTMIGDINYCMKVISSNQLYEAELFVTKEAPPMDGRLAMDKNYDTNEKMNNSIRMGGGQVGGDHTDDSKHIEIVNLIQTYSKGPVEVVDLDNKGVRRRQSAFFDPSSLKSQVTSGGDLKKKSLFGKRTSTGVRFHPQATVISTDTA